MSQRYEINEFIDVDYLDNNNAEVKFTSNCLTDRQAQILELNISEILSYTISNEHNTINLKLVFNNSVFSVLFDEYDSWAYSPINVSLVYYSPDGNISHVLHISNMFVKSRTVKDMYVTLTLSDK